MTFTQIANMANFVPTSKLARLIVRDAGRPMTTRAARRQIEEARRRVPHLQALAALEAPELPSKTDVLVKLCVSGEIRFIPTAEIGQWGKIEVIF